MRSAATLAWPVTFVGTILVIIVLAAAGDAPVFAIVALVGTGLVIAARRWSRRAD